MNLRNGSGENDATMRTDDDDICHPRLPLVVIFARHPTPGKVKTRLAAGVENEAAATFYKECAQHVVKQVTSCPSTSCCVMYSDVNEGAAVDAWLRPVHSQLSFAPQAQSDSLGDRLFHACSTGLENGHPSVVVVGTDVPSLSPQLITQALSLLASHDIVFGPAADGGYYLVATRSVPPGLFDSIEWSTGQVLEQNIKNAERLGLSVAPTGDDGSGGGESGLSVLRDIDTIQDLEIWIKQLDVMDHPLLDVALETLNAVN
jgi:uncharacterized protein